MSFFCSSKWQKAAELIGNKCEGKVPDLVEGMKYTFRVIAVNKGGQSKPSEPSDPIIAKDRKGAFHKILAKKYYLRESMTKFIKIFSSA